MEPQDEWVALAEDEMRAESVLCCEKALHLFIFVRCFCLPEISPIVHFSLWLAIALIILWTTAIHRTSDPSRNHYSRHVCDARPAI